ncbi:BON domain-containing protein [Kitasatospora sp. NPDC050467]|uniref:BON domain-containing protein n=1 Tax=Kitasatospora sp. NPDC050467 TaxID=3364053 RepID=UPI003787E945
MLTHRTLRDVMTRDVVRIAPACGFREIIEPLGERDIVEEVLRRVEGVSAAAVGVEAGQGRVVLGGVIEPPYLVPIVVRLCRSVDGVVSVTDRTGRVPEQMSVTADPAEVSNQEARHGTHA